MAEDQFVVNFNDLGISFMLTELSSMELELELEILRFIVVAMGDLCTPLLWAIVKMMLFLVMHTLLISSDIGFINADLAM